MGRVLRHTACVPAPPGYPMIRVRLASRMVASEGAMHPPSSLPLPGRLAVARTRWVPYSVSLAMATIAAAWPAAGYGALVIWTAGDFTATGSLWIFGWPFLVELLA